MIRLVPTICPYCGTGCSVHLIVHDDKVTGIFPHIRSPINEGKICQKGASCHHVIHHPDRLKKPLIRRGDVFVEVDWDTAYHLIIQKLKHYQPHQIGVLASAQCSNEDNYVLMKFARGVLRTNNVDHAARLCRESTMAGLSFSFGLGVMTNPISDLRASDCILSLGSNPLEQYPLIGRQIVRARAAGGRFIYGDPRHTPTALHADLFLRYEQGADLAILNCIMGEIIRNGWENQSFIHERTKAYESLKKVVLKSIYTPHETSKLTGVAKDDIIRAAEWIGNAKRLSVLYGRGISERMGGLGNIKAIANLMMLTGNIGRPGTGVYALCGQSNLQGACDMGCMPGFFPGYLPVTDSQVHQSIQSTWGFPDPIAPARTGLDLTRMLQTAGRTHEGILAMIVVGENPLLTEQDGLLGAQGDKKLEFLVVSDIFFTKTCEYADVILPAACFAEKDGTATNTERRVQRLNQAVLPPGHAKPDWKIFTDIACRMGYTKQFPYQSPSDIFTEITQVCKPYQGMTFERVSNPDGICWPCPSSDHPGTTLLYSDRFFHPDGKGVFCPVEWNIPSHTRDPRYPFLLISGRTIWHWHSGTMTRRCKNHCDEVHAAYIEVHPSDAAHVGIKDGDMVYVRSHNGMVSCIVRVVPGIQEGMIWMPSLFDASLIRLIGVSDMISGSNECARVFVTLEPVIDKGSQA